MRTFQSIYEFYDLPRRDRKHLIDQVIVEAARPATGTKGKHSPPLPPMLYFPVGLVKGEFNYGKPEGLVFVTNMCTLKATNGRDGKPERKWFKVGVCSPDDLDRDLCFEGMPKIENVRERVIAHLKAMNKRDVTYKGVLESILAHVGGKADGITTYGVDLI